MPVSPQQGFAHSAGDWNHRLDLIVDTVRNLSTQTEPQAMFHAYRERMNRYMPSDRTVSLSRRGLEAPYVRVTRSTTWLKEIDPWAQPEKLPMLDGGLFSQLIYADKPTVLDTIDISEDDPAYDYVKDLGSLIAIPLYDQGVALNMVVVLRREPGAFSREEFPETVMTSNLFGRATHNLVLSRQLRHAYQEVDNELKVVADIQRSLLPSEMPKIPTIDLAASYQTSRRAGGDYYDFFELPNGKLGILIADVSGHGTPAAVLMAVTHSLSHANPVVQERPSAMLRYLNRALFDRYTGATAFVTAFYGVYDPDTRRLTYASAGHNPPRVKRCADGSIFSLDAVGDLILGILRDVTYTEAEQQFQPGDQIVFYTDGITEAMNPEGQLFGAHRLDEALEICSLQASGLIQEVLGAVERFANGHPADDDRTVLVAKIS